MRSTALPRRISAQFQRCDLSCCRVIGRGFTFVISIRQQPGGQRYHKDRAGARPKISSLFFQALGSQAIRPISPPHQTPKQYPNPARSQTGKACQCWSRSTPTNSWPTALSYLFPAHRAKDSLCKGTRSWAESFSLNARSTIFSIFFSVASS